jgi:hypothetical protein
MIPEPITIDGRTGTVVYLDNEWHPCTSEQAMMARVLFDDGGSAFYMAQESVQKFDEAKHPREPGGTEEGGQFTASGHTGEPTPDPELAKQAEAGIAAVEKLLPVAVKTADYSDIDEDSGDWSDVDDTTQDRVREKFIDQAYSNGVDVDTSGIEEDLRNDLERDNQEVLDEAVDETIRVLESKFPVAEPVLDITGSTERPFELRKTLDPDTLDYGPGEHENGKVALDLEALRFKTGEKLTPAEQEIVMHEWNRHYKIAFQQKLDDKFQSDEFYERQNELESEAVNNEWSNLSDKERFQLMRDYGITPSRDLSTGEPDQWVTGVETGTHTDEDYARTHAIALRLAEMRTEEIRKERGLTEPGEKPKYEVVEATNSTPEHPNFIAKDAAGRVIASSNTRELAEQNANEWAQEASERAASVTSEKLIGDVWHAWKQKSSEGLGLSLQLAAARELGGHHRMTPEEVSQAEQIAHDYGGMANLQAYVRAQWEVTQMVMNKAGQEKVEVYRGLMLPGDAVKTTSRVPVDKLGQPLNPPTNVKSLTTPGDPTKAPYVTFDFNGEHFVVEKARILPQSIKEVGQIATGKAPVYESDETAIQRRMDEYVASSQGRLLFTKLPDLTLKRAGAQSTTGTREVANDWGGVGNLPPNPVRVVLRIEAPATSVLSIPVYGQNEQNEHETVIVGTKDKWLWDAWRDRAPDFASQSVAHKAETKPLEIDLQAEDRGKPHWMSSVDWAKVKAEASKEKP